MPEQQDWHLEKKFSVSLIFLLCAQIAAAAWFAASTDGRVAQLEKATVALAEQVSENRSWQIDQRVRVWERVDDIDNKMDTLTVDVRALVVELSFLNKQLESLQANGRSTQ